MADEEIETDEPLKKASKLPLLLGLVFAIVGGAGSFFYMYSSGDDASTEVVAEVSEGLSPLQDIAFVPLTPMVIALGDGSPGRLLRFQAQLEVNSTHEDEVTFLEPRIMDVLNTYLRAVPIEDLENRRALMRLRAHMLRRVQVVTGEGQVRDLLITEFVLT